MPKFLDTISWHTSSGVLKNIDEIPAIKGVPFSYFVLVSNNNNPTWVDIGLTRQTITHNFPSIDITTSFRPAFSSFYTTSTESGTNTTLFNITNDYTWYMPPNMTAPVSTMTPQITITDGQGRTLQATNSSKWDLSSNEKARLKSYILSAEMPNVSTSTLSSATGDLNNNIVISSLPTISVSPTGLIQLTSPSYVSITYTFKWTYRTATVNSQLAKNDLDTLKGQVESNIWGQTFDFLFTNYSYTETVVRPQEQK